MGVRSSSPALSATRQGLRLIGRELKDSKSKEKKRREKDEPPAPHWKTAENAHGLTMGASYILSKREKKKKKKKKKKEKKEQLQAPGA